jgi:hypothetical protein
MSENGQIAFGLSVAGGIVTLASALFEQAGFRNFSFVVGLVIGTLLLVGAPNLRSGDAGARRGWAAAGVVLGAVGIASSAVGPAGPALGLAAGVVALVDGQAPASQRP